VVEVTEGIFDVLEFDMVSGISFHEFGGLLDETAGLDFHKNLQHCTNILFKIGDSTLFGDLVNKVLVSEEGHLNFRV
jgi:hypothetical protein